MEKGGAILMVAAFGIMLILVLSPDPDWWTKPFGLEFSAFIGISSGILFLSGFAMAFRSTKLGILIKLLKEMRESGDINGEKPEY